MVFKILYHSHPDGDLNTGREYTGKQACDFLLINLKKTVERLGVEEKAIQAIWITEFRDVRHLETKNSASRTDRNGRKLGRWKWWSGWDQKNGACGEW